MAQGSVTGIWFMYCIHKFRDSPMIYSQATCLTTGQRMWIGRKTDLGPQFGYGDQPTQIESSWIAGVHAETYAKEALSKIPSFE